MTGSLSPEPQTICNSNRSSSKRKTSTRFGPQKDRKLCVISQAPRATSELRKTSNRPQELLLLLLLLVLLNKSDAEEKQKNRKTKEKPSSRAAAVVQILRRKKRKQTRKQKNFFPQELLYKSF
jgi:hypothetical protein